MNQHSPWLFEAPPTLAVPLPRQRPNSTISGFPRYSNVVKLLPPQEQKKINAIAQQIIQSYQLSRYTIVTVRLVGYADQDTPRRPNFERKISGQRAQEVQSALIATIERLSKPLQALPPISIRINWQRIPAGARKLVVQKPVTEPERARNRRVEIYLSTTRSRSTSRFRHSTFNSEVSDPSQLSPKLEQAIQKFLSRVGDRAIDRSNCYKAVTIAAGRLSQKGSKKTACPLNYSGEQLVEAKENNAPLSKTVVCYPWTSDFYGICKTERGRKTYGHCSGINGRYVVLKYKPLTNVVIALKNALDNRCLIRAGVLSGMCDDKPDRGCEKSLAGKGLVWRDCPEHWLLIIGYDGNKFLFWDSAKMSNINRNEHEHTFGLLHYIPSENRLTTAPDHPNQDTLTVVPRRDDWDIGGGWHIFDNHQKRYQVLALHFAGSF